MFLSGFGFFLFNFIIKFIFVVVLYLLIKISCKLFLAWIKKWFIYIPWPAITTLCECESPPWNRGVQCACAQWARLRWPVLEQKWRRSGCACGGLPRELYSIQNIQLSLLEWVKRFKRSDNNFEKLSRLSRSVANVLWQNSQGHISHILLTMSLLPNMGFFCL